jgi:7-cyano-7-deazaguanine reductase
MGVLRFKQIRVIAQALSITGNRRQRSRARPRAMAGAKLQIRRLLFVQSSYMASSTKRTEPRYTEDHAKAGLDFKFPDIETWPNQFPGYEIAIDDPEFTSVCPKTGLPDFGVILLRYVPRKKCLELKSYKEYLFSYRDLGIFQENVVNQVLKDVVKACDPVWATVHGEFRPRGGISTVVDARWPRKKSK